MRATAVSVSVILLLSGALAAEGQSLAEVARRTREKREKAAQERAAGGSSSSESTQKTGSEVDTVKTPAEPPKVFTEADLAAAQGGSVVETTYDGATESYPAGGSEMRSPQLRSVRSPSSKGSGEAYWRDRLAAAKEAVVRADNRVAELVRLQGILNEAEPCQLGVDRYASDARKKKEPSSFDEKTRQREKFCKDYSASVVKAKNLLAQLDAARQNAEQARKALADLPDEALRAGALPGWLR